MNIIIRYYYFKWEEGRPDEIKLANEKEFVWETPNSKDGIYDGWAFFVSNKKLTEKELVFLDDLDLENGMSYTVNKTFLEESMSGNMKNIKNILVKNISKNCLFRIRIKKDSGRVKLRGKYRGQGVTFSKQGRIFSSKANLNRSLQSWPLSIDEEIVIFETREICSFSGNEYRYGIKTKDIEK